MLPKFTKNARYDAKTDSFRGEDETYLVIMPIWNLLTTGRGYLYYKKQNHWTSFTVKSVAANQ